MQSDHRVLSNADIPLSTAIDSDTTSILSEGHALLDYGIHSQRLNEWIVSHERLRRIARNLKRQLEATKK